MDSLSIKGGITSKSHLTTISLLTKTHYTRDESKNNNSGSYVLSYQLKEDIFPSQFLHHAISVTCYFYQIY